MAQETWTTEVEKMSEQDSQRYCLTDLPSDVLVMILEYLPLFDLANVRLVCSVLQLTVDDKRYVHLWANASLELQWFSEQHRAIFERAARCGNFESLIKLAVAFLYSEGVPDGPGKGTAAAMNGMRATEYLCKAELHSPHIQPFSWVLIRPPWASNNMCCKACVCHNLKKLCFEANCSEEVTLRLHYCIGKALSFHEPTESEKDEARRWFERGSQQQCPHCFHELWKARSKETNKCDEVMNTRTLRKAAAISGCADIQLQLCEVYAEGYYGGIPRDQALQYIRHMVASSVPIMSAQIFTLQSDMTHIMRYILVDWLLEVAEMKQFPSATVHLAISIVDRYLLRRRIHKTQLQLLGITALVLASRWMDMTIVTIREAAWLTDNTYKYEEVVRMMGDVIAALRGDLRRATVCDFLEIFLKLAGADTPTKCMAHYLSECLLFHVEFGQFSAAHIGASCVLLAKVLMKQAYPWPASMLETTGCALHDLRKCCLMIYSRCMTKHHAVTDHRNVKLHAVEDRFGDSRFCGISKHQIMSYDELKDYLGIETESPSKLPRSTLPKHPFLENTVCLEKQSPIEDCLVEQFNTNQLSSDGSNGSDTASSRENSPLENSGDQPRNSPVSAHPDVACRCSSSELLLDEDGLLSDETMEDMMEVEACNPTRMSRGCPYPSTLGPLHHKAALSDRLHRSCPSPFPHSVCETIPSASSSFSSFSRVCLKTTLSKTLSPKTCVKSRGDMRVSREPLKSLDNFSFVALSPGKLKQSIQSMCISRKNSPSIPMS